MFADPATTYHDMGGIYLELKKFTQAIKCYELSLESAKGTNYMDSHVASAKSGLAEAYYGLGDFKKAIDYERKFSQLRDSLSKEITSAEMVRLQNDFEQSRETDMNVRLDAAKPAHRNHPSNGRGPSTNLNQEVPCVNGPGGYSLYLSRL